MGGFFVICDNIRSLENIGSIFRTADALKIDKIILCGISGRPPRWGSPALKEDLVALHPKISKAALGAEKTVPLEHYWQVWKAIDNLKKEKFKIIVLENNLPRKLAKKSIAYDKFKPKFPLALVLGNEIKGISKSVFKKADKIVYLPMLGGKESLNVAVAFGVIGYEINKHRFC